jgi:hypothetical protein
MSLIEDLQYLYSRAQTLEAELASVTEQLQGLGFNVVFDDAPSPLPSPPPPLPKSRFRGVSWHRKGRKWQAQRAASKAGPAKYLKHFVSEEAAALAWDKEARKRGLVNKLNFPLA